MIYMGKFKKLIVIGSLSHANHNTLLIKMSVDVRARGHKIGTLLCSSALEKAKSLGAEKVILHSNTHTSKTAIDIYYALGFKKIPLGQSEFQRANIKMEIDI